MDRYRSYQEDGSVGDARPYVIRELLALGADREGQGREEGRGALLYAISQAYWANATTIFQYRAREGRVDPKELEAALYDAARDESTGGTFLLHVAPLCWKLLERRDQSAVSAEKNAQDVEQCMRKCLAKSIKAPDWKRAVQWTNVQSFSHIVAQHLIRTGVKPEMNHLAQAIRAWDTDLCHMIIRHGELDLKAKRDGCRISFANPIVGDISTYISKGDEKGEALNPVEFALLIWQGWQSGKRRAYVPSASPTLLCDLLHYAGAPDLPARGVREALVYLFETYFVNATDPAWRARGTQIKSGSVQFTRKEDKFLLENASAPLLDRLTMLCVTLQKWLTPGSQG